MVKALFWINADSTDGNVRNTTREQRSIIQSQVQRGRPRKRKPKAGVSPSTSEKPSQSLTRPKEIYDPVIRGLSADIDPFDSACVPIDTTAKGLLRYYVHRYHPSQWPGLPFAPDNGAYSFKSSVDRIISTSIEDSLMMYCLLTATSSRLQHTDRLCFPNVAKREDLYTQQALQLMRGHIEQSSSISDDKLSMLLQCITFITSAESYRGNHAAASIHLKACLALLEPHGGIMQLEDRHIQGQILMGDLFLACINLKPCLCGCDYDPGPAMVLDLQPYEHAGSGHTLQGTELLRQDSFIANQPIQTLVEQIVETYDIRTNMDTKYMTPSRVLETGQWVTLRNMAIRNRLLSLEPSDQRLGALRAALIMWTLLAMNYTGRVTTVKVMANSLREILRDIVPHDWAECREVMLWILFVGHACALENSPTATWFQNEIQLSVGLCIDLQQPAIHKDKTVDDLEKFQMGFLYHAPIQRPFTEQIGAALFRIQEESDCKG